MSISYSVTKNANRPGSFGGSIFGETPGGLVGLIQQASDSGLPMPIGKGTGLMRLNDMNNAAIQNRRWVAERALDAQLGPAELQMKMQKRVLENMIDAIKAQARHQKRLYDTPVNINPAPRAERPEPYQR